MPPTFTTNTHMFLHHRSSTRHRNPFTVHLTRSGTWSTHPERPTACIPMPSSERWGTTKRTGTTETLRPPLALLLCRDLQSHALSLETQKGTTSPSRKSANCHQKKMQSGSKKLISLAEVHGPSILRSTDPTPQDLLHPPELHSPNRNAGFKCSKKEIASRWKLKSTFPESG